MCMSYIASQLVSTLSKLASNGHLHHLCKEVLLFMTRQGVLALQQYLWRAGKNKVYVHIRIHIGSLYNIILYTSKLSSNCAKHYSDMHA